MTIVTAMLFIILGLVVHFTSNNLELQSQQMLQTVASKPFQPKQPNGHPDDVRLPYFLVQIGSHGEFIVTGNGYYEMTDEDLLRKIMGSALALNEQTGELEEYNLRFFRILNPKTPGFVFADISAEKATINNLIKTCIIIGVLCFIVFLFISFLLAHWSVKPMDLAWTQQRQFVADASHELKTPLTVILTNAELLQNPKYNETERSQFSSNILTMAQQMRGLVERLLDLARVDNSLTNKAFDSIDFSRLVSDSVLPFEPLYFEKTLDLCCQIDAGITINGSQSHLQQVLDILLDNAMKYSFPQTVVNLNLKKQGHSCFLTVSNQGELISKEDLENIFKRFYRIDKARSMNRSYGLGLSIAEKIIHEHKGKIWAESVAGINSFYVQLPTI